MIKVFLIAVLFMLCIQCGIKLAKAREEIQILREHKCRTVDVVKQILIYNAKYERAVDRKEKDSIEFYYNKLYKNDSGNY